MTGNPRCTRAPLRGRAYPLSTSVSTRRKRIASSSARPPHAFSAREEADRSIRYPSTSHSGHHMLRGIK
eukprot:2920100-Rhodomonas_salina.1